MIRFIFAAEMFGFFGSWLVFQIGLTFARRIKNAYR